MTLNSCISIYIYIYFNYISISFPDPRVLMWRRFRSMLKPSGADTCRSSIPVVSGIALYRAVQLSD